MSASTAKMDDVVSLVERRPIVAFVNDEPSASALRTGFDGIAQTFEVKRGGIREAIRLLESNIELHSVIADVSGIANPFDALEALERVCPPDVKVALVGDDTNIAFYRKLLDLGVQEYLPKPLTRDNVQTLLRPKLVGDVLDEAVRSGHVISICGAQGGAGATSIAVNLALQIADTTKAKVALLDLHLQGGEASVLFGVRPGPGLRMALEDPLRADTLFLERAAIDVNERVKLIAADEDIDAELHITEAGVRHVLSLLRHRFNYIVVDVPVPLTPALRSVISLSRHVLVLLEAEVTGLRNAHGLQTAVTNIAGKNRVFTVLNRANRPGGLALSVVTKGLGTKPDIIIPDLGRKMTEAVNHGVPAYHRLPALRRCLNPIIREVAGIKTERKWRLFGR